MMHLSPRAPLVRIVSGLLCVAAFGGCKKTAAAPDVPTATVVRRNISVSTDATGTVEPVDTVAVKRDKSRLDTSC